jgi:membrane protein
MAPAKADPAATPLPWWPVRAVQLWLEADGPRMSAAMSFYGMLSLAPLLVVVVASLGWWLDRTVVELNLLAQIRTFTSERTAEVVRQALASAQAPTEGLLASVVALLLLLWGATGVFAELQASFARIWHSQAPALGGGWRVTAALRVRGLAYLLALGFLLLLSLLMSAALALATAWLGAYFPYRLPLLILSEGASFLFATALFLGLMRISASPKPRLRFLAWGALLGAGLFTVGRHGLASYLSGAAVVSAYGAAGSLVALLVWIYFSSAALLLAAACARALEERAAVPGISVS